MKSRRRNYIAIIGVCSLLAVVVCWQWVTWPARTATRFLELVAANRKGDWLPMLTPPCDAPADDQLWLETNLAAQNRDFGDIARARQNFTILVGDPDGDLNVNFTVVCGKITRMDIDWGFPQFDGIDR